MKNLSQTTVPKYDAQPVPAGTLSFHLNILSDRFGCKVGRIAKVALDARESLRRRQHCIATVHDSLLTPPSSAGYVETVMLDEFARWGVQPFLNRKSHARLSLPVTNAPTSNEGPGLR
jgi:hypothetical protein